MKKIISLLLALVMCLSLCACGGDNNAAETEAPSETTVPEKVVLSKEEMEAVATPYTGDDLGKAIDNKAFASSFVGNVYSFEGTVFSIETDHVILEFYIEGDGSVYTTTSSVLSAKVHLPVEELAELQSRQKIKVVGEVSSVSGNKIVFENAFIDQYYEMTATLKGKNHSYDGAYNIQIGDSSRLKLVYFADDVDLSGINTDGDEITFLTKIVYDIYHSVSYVDAIIP